jgi:segregation and condensation protein B
VLAMLRDRGLVQVAGRANSPGRPLLYATTSAFLELFGLRDLSDLPTLRDLRELRRDDPRLGPGDLPEDDEFYESDLDDDELEVADAQVERQTSLLSPELLRRDHLPPDPGAPDAD